MGRFHNGMGPDVERGQWCGHLVSGHGTNVSSQPRVHKWAGSTMGWVLMWNGDSGADTWCPAMEPMCQIMFYNHLATFGYCHQSWSRTASTFRSILKQNAHRFLNIKIILSRARGRPRQFLIIYSPTFNSLTQNINNNITRFIHTLL